MLPSRDRGQSKMTKRTQLFVEPTEVPPVGFGFGGGFVDGCGGRLGHCGAASGLQAFEIVQGAVEGAVGGIGAPLEEGEVLAAADKIQANAVGVVTDTIGITAVVPDLGVGEAIAAQQPIAIDEGGDEKALFRSGGLPAGKIGVGEGTEFGGIFARDDLGPGIETGFEGVGTGGGLAPNGEGPVDFRAFLRFASIWL